MKLSHAVLGVLSVGLVGGAELQAQRVEFAGTTSGCFFFAGVCSSPDAFYLHFVGGSFSGQTTSSGFLAINGDVGNLGTFRLGVRDKEYDKRFLLNIVFSLPTLTYSSVIFRAAVEGAVEERTGGVFINFRNTTQVFTFNGPDAPGYFTLTVNDLAVFPGDGQTKVTGFIRTTVTPEPATLALLATGLAGLIPAVRRRRRLGV